MSKEVLGTGIYTGATGFPGHGSENAAKTLREAFPSRLPHVAYTLRGLSSPLRGGTLIRGTQGVGTTFGPSTLPSR